MQKPVVVGIGELLWDMLPEGKRAGGAPINFVYNATQLGADGYAVSAIGQDALGDEIIRELEKSHIHHVLQRNNYPTGVVEVALKNGIPTYTIVEGVAWDHLQATAQEIEIVQKADAVCFGTLALRSASTKKAILTLLKNVPDKAYKLFDVNLRSNYFSHELIDTLLQEANVFKINDEEMIKVQKLYGLQLSDEDVCHWFIQKYNLRYLIFTAGEKYSSVYAANGEKSFIETPKIKVADTVGAGDSFSAGFIMGLLGGKSMREAHKQAVATAAFVCSKNGAWPEYK
ncbi:MAG: carbohydrate kinase [Pseudomonadota bacterium]|nr:carbohydrate kinase [Pseudomonadota bacterium]